MQTDTTIAQAQKDWWRIADQEDVWRVCHALRTADDKDCEHCPPSEDFNGHGDCTRGCYMIAVELVNITETGNPWRKTADVKAPWTTKAAPSPPLLSITEEQLEKACRAYDAEDAARRGEPSPLGIILDNDCADEFERFVSERFAAMRAALEAIGVQVVG